MSVVAEPLVGGLEDFIREDGEHHETAEVASGRGAEGGGLWSKCLDTRNGEGGMRSGWISNHRWWKEEWVCEFQTHFDHFRWPRLHGSVCFHPGRSGWSRDFA